MDPWVSLFSGGKDSSWALYQAIEQKRPIERLVTVHPTSESFMYHMPATELAELAAESIGIPLVDVYPTDFEATAESDETAGERGDRELEPLEEALAALADELGSIGGVTAGAVESSYQTDRIQRMCDRLGAELFAPLWQREPRALIDSMLDAGFEITIVRVAADGLGESWLGRTIDHEAVRELEALNETHGVHILGEGGEFETLVTDGPHMKRPIELDGEAAFDGIRGTFQITDAQLGDPTET